MQSPTLLIDRLAAFPPALRATLAIVTAADARWKPPSGAWSILEVTCHLADEETLDFGARLFSTLENPTTPWTANDPEAWARDNHYNDQDLAAALDRFTTAREHNVARLRALKNPNWSTAYIHPRVGPVTAAELLTSWPAHDALHLRQIAKRLFELAQRNGAPAATTYAGTWTA